ncbi:hypothetical protein BJY04DRAFT_81177 [Aspergillus karnatakaensis]|uniref:uncharacterized protein n=1 Tax=Aspergillus karnatakaensis TaxID=1810916 RepID=UPI003CCDF461
MWIFTPIRNTLFFEPAPRLRTDFLWASYVLRFSLVDLETQAISFRIEDIEIHHQMLRKDGSLAAVAAAAPLGLSDKSLLMLFTLEFFFSLFILYTFLEKIVMDPRGEDKTL